MGFKHIIFFVSLILPLKIFALTKTQILVWDNYFDHNSNVLAPHFLKENFGNIYSIDPDKVEENKSHTKGIHGAQVSYLIAKDNPNTILHRAYNSGFPWQDPEKCSLVTDNELNQEMEKHGYSNIPDCIEKAKKSIDDFSAFIKKNKIKIVNISHGVFFETSYNINNPYLLKNSYPLVEIDYFFRFVYKNFIELKKLVATLFEQNNDVLFIVAAGNNSYDIDSLLYLKGFESSKLYPVPTLYASLTNDFDNVISVGSSYDGKKLANESNYGPNLLIAHNILGVTSIDSKGSISPFEGTSAAAADVTRIVSKYLSKYQAQDLTPKQIKDIVIDSVEKSLKLKNLVSTEGFFSEEKFAINIQKRYDLSPRREIYNNFNKSNRSSSESKKMPVEALQGEFEIYHVPEDINPKNYGCHSLAVDKNDNIWMTLPWANVIASFDPKTKKFTKHNLITPESRPDGITVDFFNQAWAGTDPMGGLFMMNTETWDKKDFPHHLLSTLNITTVDTKNQLWATGHRAQVISLIDQPTGQFKDWKVKMDWPLDIRADNDGSIWATALKGFGAPWGQGAILYIKDDSSEIEYFPLPAREERLQAYWLSTNKDYVITTLMRDGLIRFNKTDKTMEQFQREDGIQMYQIIRKLNDNTFVMANHHEKLKSLDVINPNKMDKIISYKLPDQNGEPRETITFDSKGDVWFCQTFTDILGKLKLNP